MRLLLYYMSRSLKNQIRKLCKSWVVIFVTVCFLMGAGIGIFAASMEDAVDGDVYVEDIPEEQYEEDIIEKDESMFNGIFCLATGGIVLLYLVFSVYSGDKNGSSIFQMADVNLLFSAPMKPQSVLLFRLLCQIGTMAVASVYLVFQLPNLHYNLGFSIEACVALLVVFVLMTVYGKLLSLLTYSVSTTHERLKKYVTPFSLGILAVVFALYSAYCAASEKDLLNAAFDFFNSPVSVYIPVWGWLKGISQFVLEGNMMMAVLMMVLSILGIVFLVWFIWRLKVDFYEDAMAKSAEMAERLAHARADGKSVLKRKKDRTEKLRRNGYIGGSGASVVFFKEMYNRFRFAKLYVFTKTSVVYLCVAFLSGFVIKLGFEATVIILAVIVFFRALGDAVTKEVSMEIFLMIPEKPFKKMFWAHLAAIVNCVLDILPAIVLSAVVYRANPLPVIAYLFVIVAMDLYSTSISTAIDLSLPSSVGFTVKQVIAIMFVYFGLIPEIMIGCIFGVIAGSIEAGIFAAGSVAMLLSMLAVCIASRILYHGKR